METSRKLLIEGLDGDTILKEFLKIDQNFKQILKKVNSPVTEGDISKPYYSRKEVKEMLSVSYPTLNTWAKRGILNPCRIGSRVVYRAEDLRKAIVPMKG